MCLYRTLAVGVAIQLIHVREKTRSISLLIVFSVCHVLQSKRHHLIRTYSEIIAVSSKIALEFYILNYHQYISTYSTFFGETAIITQLMEQIWPFVCLPVNFSNCNSEFMVSVLYDMGNNNYKTSVPHI